MTTKTHIHRTCRETATNLLDLARASLHQALRCKRDQNLFGEIHAKATARAFRVAARFVLTGYFSRQ